jgi:hypothetical protein
VWDVMAGAERIGHRVSGCCVDRAQAETAIERGKRQPGAGFAIAAMGYRAREIAADKPDSLQRVEID